MLSLELVHRFNCRNYFRDLIAQRIRHPAPSLTSAHAENKESERCNQPARSQPMIPIPSMFVRTPVLRQRLRCPLCNPVVDRHWTDQRKYNGEDLDYERYRG